MINRIMGSVSVSLVFVLLAIIQPCFPGNPRTTLPVKPYRLYWSRTGDTSLVITFNLETKQHINLQLIDMKGHLVINKELQEVTAQTFYIETTHQGAGLYIVRIMINNTCYIDKVYLNN